MLYSYIAPVLEFLCIYYTAKSFKQVSLKPTKNDCIACLVILLFLGSIPPSYSLPLWLAGQIIYFLYILVLCLPNIMNGSILYCLSLGSLLITQLLIASALTIFDIKITFENMNIIGNLLTLLVLIVLLRCKKIKNIYSMMLHAALPYRLILINTYLLYSGAIIFYKSNPSTLQHEVTFTVILVLFLITANVCILYYDQKIYAQKRELLSYQKNLPIYEALIHEIRANQHEYTNRLQTLQNLTAMYTDYDSLCRAIHQYTKEYTKPLRAYPLLQINMPLLAAALYHLSSLAEARQIDIQFDVVTEILNSRASEQQLADFACILTQNAIEACKEKDNIYIRLSSDENMVHFEIRNPVDSFYSSKDIGKFFTKGYSTKNEYRKPEQSPHGLGLYTLHHQVTKIGGLIGADCVEYNHKYWMIFHLDI